MEPAKKKRKTNAKQCRVWDFTAWEPTTKDKIVSMCKSLAGRWCFQLEETKSGKSHFQGRMSFKVAKRKSEVLNVFEAYEVKGHVSLTSNACRNDMFYVQKDESRIDGPWANTDAKIPWQLARIEKLHPWQESVREKLEVKEDRIINVIIDQGGNVGKSTLMGWLEVHGYGVEVPCLNRFQDLMQLVCCIVKTMKPKEPKAFFIDFPRALKQHELAGLFSAVEKIKGGYAFDTRYKFVKERFGAPQIWIFMNTKPEMEMLTPDRWKLWMISELKTLIPYHELPRIHLDGK